MIRLLTERHLPLREIRQSLGQLSEDDRSDVIREEEARERSRGTPRSGSPREYLNLLLAETRSDNTLLRQGIESPQPSVDLDTWRRTTIAPGIEIHVSFDVERNQPALARDVIAAARSAAKARKQKQVP